MCGRSRSPRAISPTTLRWRIRRESPPWHWREFWADSLSGAPLDEVAAVPADVIYRIFGRELSMGKSLGLMGMVNMVRTAARQQMQAAETGNCK